MKEEIKLCPGCEKQGYCEFERYVIELAEKQKLLHSDDPEILLSQAVSINIDISRRRDEFREHGCLCLNDVDPDYPGKNLL